MGAKRPVSNRQYTPEFKLEAARLSESIGQSATAKRLGIPESSVGNWVRLSRAGKLGNEEGVVAPVKRGASELEEENARLRRELANAKLDLEIVKKAAAYFARESR
jgi:transposase